MTGGGFPPEWTRAAFSADANPSFSDLLRRADPAAFQVADQGAVAAAARADLPHGTTVLAMRFDGGIVMAGDRRATAGNLIADRRMEKVFPADDHSAVAIAGAAGPAIDMVKLLQVEVEHYEKIEGESLSLEGKANKLAQMIKMNFPMAMQGLVVVPIFGGYDVRRGEGRLFRYDAVGGRYEETDFCSTGSGSLHATASLKKRYRKDMGRDEAVRVALEALMDAADEDTATGGPDLDRGIFPNMAVVVADGYTPAGEAELRTVAEELLAQRRNA